MNQAWLDAHCISAALDHFVVGRRCAWNLATIAELAGLLAQLHSAAPPQSTVNSWWHPLKESFVEGCPISVIHADVWQGNVIESIDGRLVLIDWEHAGLGHSILDLACLISDCENEDQVECALGSYSAMRRMSENERRAIAPAIRHMVKYRIEIKRALGRTDSLDREYQRLERSSQLRL